MNAPAVVIRLELERAPVVYVDTVHEGERDRLRDWLQQHPESIDLIRRARRLAEQERAA